MTKSSRSVTSFSVAYIAAKKTKRKMPPTQKMIAVIDFRVGECPETVSYTHLTLPTILRV